MVVFVRKRGTGHMAPCAPAPLCGHETWGSKFPHTDLHTNTFLLLFLDIVRYAVGIINGDVYAECVWPVKPARTRIGRPKLFLYDFLERLTLPGASSISMNQLWSQCPDLWPYWDNAYRIDNFNTYLKVRFLYIFTYRLHIIIIVKIQYQNRCLPFSQIRRIQLN